MHPLVSLILMLSVSSVAISGDPEQVQRASSLVRLAAPLASANLSSSRDLGNLSRRVDLDVARGQSLDECRRSGDEERPVGPHLAFMSFGRLAAEERADWLKATVLLEPVYWPLKDKIADALQNISLHVSTLEAKCKMSLEQLVYYLRRGDSLAYRMMDSFGSYGSSLFSHRLTSLGDYSQCIGIKFNSSFARYTLIQVHLPLPADHQVLKIHRQPGDSSRSQSTSADWQFLYSEKIGTLRYIPQVFSVCLPSQCSVANINSILQSTYVRQQISPIKLTIFSSESRAEPFFEETRITSLARLTVLSIVMFTVIATYINRRSISDSNNNQERCSSGMVSSSALAAFDVVENSRKLLADPVCDERLHFFSGYKVIYLFLCTLGHSTVPLTRPIMVEGIFPHFYISTDLFSRIFSNATGFVITTNFLVTAMLSMVAILPEVKRRKGRVSILSLLVVRALRTLPTICAYILLVMSLPWMKSSSEPLVNPAQKDMLRRCSANWWREIFFISNTIDILDTCHQFAWFISADMQISIVSSLAVVFFYARPVLSIFLIAGQMIISMALQYAYLEWKAITPKLLIFSLDANSIWTGFRDIYVKTVTYVPSYTIGLAIGMLIANSVVINNPNTVRYLMILSTVCITVVTASPTLMYTDKYFNLPLSWESAYAVLSNSLHSLSIGTFIYCVYHHPRNPVVRFFSSKPFVVVSRLTFSAFMIQPLILLFNRKNRYSSLTQVQDGVFTFIECLLFGYLLYITVEAPFFNLTKFISKPSSPKKAVSSPALVSSSSHQSQSGHSCQKDKDHVE